MLFSFYKTRNSETSVFPSVRRSVRRVSVECPSSVRWVSARTVWENAKVQDPSQDASIIGATKLPKIPLQSEHNARAAARWQQWKGKDKLWVSYRCVRACAIKSEQRHTERLRSQLFRNHLCIPPGPPKFSIGQISVLTCEIISTEMPLSL